MNIQQIKAAIAANMGISLPNLTMVRQFNEAKEPQPWVSHWDNDHRVRITMHEDVLKQVQANLDKPGLAFKKEVVEATQTRAAYTRFVIITPANIEATF